jgi:hypothetical protein
MVLIEGIGECVDTLLMCVVDAAATLVDRSRIRALDLRCSRAAHEFHVATHTGVTHHRCVLNPHEVAASRSI